MPKKNIQVVYMEKAIRTNSNSVITLIYNEYLITTN